MWCCWWLRDWLTIAGSDSTGGDKDLRGTWTFHVAQMSFMLLLWETLDTWQYFCQEWQGAAWNLFQVRFGRVGPARANRVVDICASSPIESCWHIHDTIWVKVNSQYPGHQSHTIYVYCICIIYICMLFACVASAACMWHYLQSFLCAWIVGLPKKHVQVQVDPTDKNTHVYTIDCHKFVHETKFLEWPCMWRVEGDHRYVLVRLI